MDENSRLNRNNKLHVVNACVRRARAGQSDAWDELDKYFRDSSLAFCRSVLGDEDQAEDAVQEGFLEAMNVLHQLEHVEAFAVWFRRILIKQCDRVLRARPAVGNQAPGDLDEIVPPEYLAARKALGPDAQLERKEIEVQVKRALDKLPALERELCVEYYFDQRNQNEISRRRGIPLHTIKNRLLHARRHLRRHLSSGGPPFGPLALAA